MRLSRISSEKMSIVGFDYTYGAPRISFRAEASIAIGWSLSTRRLSRSRSPFERVDMKRDSSLAMHEATDLCRPGECPKRDVVQRSGSASATPSARSRRSRRPRSRCTATVSHRVSPNQRPLRPREGSNAMRRCIAGSNRTPAGGHVVVGLFAQRNSPGRRATEH